MTLIRAGLGLVASSALALLTLGPINRQLPPQAKPVAVTQANPVAATQATPVAVTPAQSKDWTVQIDSATLSQNLNAWATAQGALETPVGTARLEKLSADIRDNQLIVHGTADAGWLSMPVDATATASVQADNVKVLVNQVHVNGVDVPEAARRQLEQQLQSQLEQSVAANHVVVRSVRLGDGKLVVSGSRP
jgi:hypothetical protein